MSAHQSSGDINFNPIWTTTAQYCQLDNLGLNTGNLVHAQIDGNPNSETYGDTREHVVEENSAFCPISTTAAWRLTGNVSCVQVAGRNTGYVEKEETDVNPLSETHNTTRWINGGSDLENCPIPPQPFLRVLAQNAALGANSWTARANFQEVATGATYVLQINSAGALVNYAQATIPPGQYKITSGSGSSESVYGAAFYVSRIYLPDVFDFTQTGFDGDMNKTPNLSFTADYLVNIEVNTAIRVVFTAYP